MYFGPKNCIIASVVCLITEQTVDMRQYQRHNLPVMRLVRQIVQCDSKLCFDT